MKYLKRFEGLNSYNNEIEEFKELSNNYLAYLLDDGIKIDTSNKSLLQNGGVTLYVKLKIPRLRWSRIKDYIIPYLETIYNDYEFRTTYWDKIGFGNVKNNGEIDISYHDDTNVEFVDTFPIVDIINDDFTYSANHYEDEYYISEITFCIIFV